MATNSKKAPKKQMTPEETISSLASSSVILLAVLLLTFFFGWCYIFNTEVGVEIGANGWNFICMSFCWNFKSSAPIFGGIAVPFYYYAKYQTIILQILTTVMFYITLTLVGLSILNIKKHSIGLTKIIVALSVFNSLLLLGCFIVALTMNNSRILPKYCSGNPDCSIHSLAIFPFLVSIVILISNGMLLYKLYNRDDI